LLLPSISKLFFDVVILFTFDQIQTINNINKTLNRLKWAKVLLFERIAKKKKVEVFCRI